MDLMSGGAQDTNHTLKLCSMADHAASERGRFKWSKQRAGGFWCTKVQWFFCDVSCSKKLRPFVRLVLSVWLLQAVAWTLQKQLTGFHDLNLKLKLSRNCSGLVRPTSSTYVGDHDTSFFTVSSWPWPGLLLLVICLVAGSVWTLGVLLACSFVASLGPAVDEFAPWNAAIPVTVEAQIPLWWNN